MKNRVLLVRKIICFQYFFLFCISFLSNTANAQNQNFITIDIDKLKPQKSILYSEIFDEVKVIPLETKKECLIGNIKEILVENNFIYVLDVSISKSLFVFDLNGKFIQKIGKLGKGPGEYVSPRSFAIDNVNQQINLLDINKIIIYSLKGTFIRNVKLSGKNVNQIGNENGTIYIDRFPDWGKDNSPLLMVYNNMGNNLYNWFPYKQYNHGFTQSMGNSYHIYRTQKDIKYCRPFFDTIFSIKNQKFTPYIVLETKNRVSVKEMKQLNSISVHEFSNYLRKNRCFRGIQFYAESENMAVFMIFNPENPCYCLMNLKSQKMVFTHMLEDDLFYNKYDFYTTKEDWFIKATNHFFNTESFINNVRNGNVKLNKTEKDKILKLEPECNPVLLFYKYRKDFLN